MITRFRPIVWTGQRTPADERRSRYRFKVTYQATLNELGRELAMLGVDECVIEADFHERDIRQDGLPRANAAPPQFPGVRLAFTSEHGPLIYQTDQYELWQHNLRAIVLSLAALRAVDRYGVTGKGEQYTGFRAIESGIALPAKPEMTRAQALIQLARLSGWPVPSSDESADAGSITKAYRDAARAHHPDRGGKREDWDLLQEAMRVLGGAR